MNKVVFLDRDGTINVDKDYLYKVEDFEYLPGVVDGLKYLQSLGYLLIIITNQSGIGRGYYSEEDYYVLDKWLKEDLKKRGVIIAGSYFCPHLPDAIVERYRCTCDCRKPGTKLFWKAQADFDIDMNSSIAIGDKLRDLTICEETDMNGVLLSDGIQCADKYLVCKNWGEVIDAIKSLHVSDHSLA